MARTLEAIAPENLSSFSVKVYAADALVETIVMTHFAAVPGTWRGTIANVLSVGLLKVNFYFNGGAVAVGQFFANISAVDGTISYVREYVYADAITGGATLSGPNLVTLTFTDDNTLLPLQNVLVSLSEGVQSESKLTNASGIVTFTVTSATWNVLAAKNGYEGLSVPLVVAGNVNQAYELEPIVVVVPANPAFCTLRIRVWNLNGTVAVGADVTVRVDVAPEGMGEIFNKASVTVQTDVNGYADFTVPKSCSIKYAIGDEEEHSDRIESGDVQYVENQLGVLE